MRQSKRVMTGASFAAAMWVFACGGDGRSAAGSPTAPSAAATAGTVRLRVLTWNLHQGYTGSQRHVNREQMDLAASVNPDVVAFQELAEWDNDMPGMYRDGLQQRTGHSWMLRYEPNVPDAPKSLRQGVGLATWLPIESEDVLRLDDPAKPDDTVRNRAAVRLRINVNGVPIEVVTTHLDHQDPVDRRSQLDRVQSWLGGSRARQIVVGDFNARPDDSQTFSSWSMLFADAWASPANPLRGDTGYTVQQRGSKAPGRIDYQWYRGGVEPTQVTLVTTDLSDHYALLVEWTVPKATSPE